MAGERLLTGGGARSRSQPRTTLLRPLALGDMVTYAMIYTLLTTAGSVTSS